MLFRKNINSLRALAVSSVVLFHFDVLGFSGGFIGVDVFFVISGFLMTGIIVAYSKRSSLSGSFMRLVREELFRLCWCCVQCFWCLVLFTCLWMIIGTR